VTLEVIDDAVSESVDTLEQATLIMTPAASSGLEAGEDREANIVISDNDAFPGIGFERPEELISEVNVSRPIFVYLDDFSGRPYEISVDFDVVGGTALTDVDYHIEVDGTTIPGGSGTLTFAPFQATKAIRIVTEDDFILEDDETIQLQLSNPVNAQDFIFPEQFNFVGTILDDDVGNVPAVGFNALSSSVAENSGTVQVPVSLSLTPASQASVDYRVFNGSASGADFTATGGAIGTLVFNAGQLTQNISFTINNDTLVEGNEYLVIQLLNPTFAREGTQLNHFLVIEDDDVASEIYVSLEPANQQRIDEGDSFALLKYVLDAPAPETFTVNITVLGSTTATGGNVDFNLGTIGINFFEGDTFSTAVLGITDDDIEEDLERIDLQLSSSNSNVRFVPRNGAYDSFFLLDNDRPRSVRFNSGGAAVLEGNGTARMTLRLSEATGADVTVNYAVVGGTATAEEDYRLLESSLTFYPGETF